MQTALRPNNSREGCCCFLLFEPADADGADDSVVPDIASQDSCCRHFQQVQSCCLHACLLLLMQQETTMQADEFAFRCLTCTTGCVAGSAAWKGRAVQPSSCIKLQARSMSHANQQQYLVTKAAVDSAAFQNTLQLLLEALNYLKRGQIQCNLHLGFCS